MNIKEYTIKQVQAHITEYDARECERVRRVNAELLTALVKAETILALLCEEPQNAANIARQGYTGHAREIARFTIAKAHTPEDK